MEPTKNESDLSTLRAEVAQLRESIKEREFSVLNAIRTLVSDYHAWNQGKRDFPRAAVIGLAFAYLRPRIMLVLGSIGAMVFAAAQILALWSQNSLIEKQNTMIERQGYALEAQTAAVLVSGLDKNSDVPPYRLATLLAYGDLGFETIIQLAVDANATTGKAAREALIASAPKLRKEQAVKALVRLLDMRLKELIDLGEHREVTTTAWDSGDTPFLMPVSMVRPIREVGELFPPDALFPKVDTLGKFLYSRNFTTEDLAWLNPEQRTYLQRRIAMYYAANIGNGRSSQPPLHDAMANLCRALSSRPGTDLNRALDAQVTRHLRDRSGASVLKVVSEIVGRECGPTARDLYDMPVPFDYENVTRFEFVDFTPIDLVYFLDKIDLGPPPATVESRG